MPIFRYSLGIHVTQTTHIDKTTPITTRSEQNLRQDVQWCPNPLKFHKDPSIGLGGVKSTHIQTDEPNCES